MVNVKIFSLVIPLNLKTDLSSSVIHQKDTKHEKCNTNNEKYVILIKIVI